MKTMQHACRALAATILTLAAAGAAKAAAPAILEQLPSDAKAVVVVTNIKTLGTKLSNIGTRLNLPVPPDLAGYATRMAGITKGFDFTGSAALVLVKPADTKEEKPDEMQVGPPPAVVLLPTTDPKGMLEGMQPGEADKDGIRELTLPGPMAEKGFAATVGGDKWVVLAQERDVLTNYLKHTGNLANRLPEETLKVFEANDIVVWANVPAISVGVDKWLEDHQQEFTGMMDLANLAGTKPEAVSALEKGAVNEIFAGVKQYFKDAQAALLTFRATDEGITLGLIGSFKTGTPFAKFVAAQKPAKPLTFEGLPAGDFLMAGAVAWDGKTVGELLDASMKRVLSDEVIKKDPKAADYQKFADQYRQAIAMTSGMSMVLLDKPSKEGIMNGAAVIDTADPAKYMALQKELWNNPLMHEMSSANPDIEQTMTVVPDAITVKNIKLSKLEMKWKLREETADKPLSPGSKMGFDMIQKMYGKDGVTIYSGEVGKHVLTVIGTDATTMENAVLAAQADTTELANNALIAGARQQVVPDTVGVLYLPITRWMTVMQSMLPGATPAAPGGGGVAPVVISAGVTGSTLTAETYVPISAIIAVKDAVQRMMRGGIAPPGEGMQP